MVRLGLMQVSYHGKKTLSAYFPGYSVYYTCTVLRVPIDILHPANTHLDRICGNPTQIMQVMGCKSANVGAIEDGPILHLSYSRSMWTIHPAWLCDLHVSMT